MFDYNLEQATHRAKTIGDELFRTFETSISRYPSSRSGALRVIQWDDMIRLDPSYAREKKKLSEQLEQPAAAKIRAVLQDVGNRVAYAKQVHHVWREEAATLAYRYILEEIVALLRGVRLPSVLSPHEIEAYCLLYHLVLQHTDSEPPIRFQLDLALDMLRAMAGDHFQGPNACVIADAIVRPLELNDGKPGAFAVSLESFPPETVFEINRMRSTQDKPTSSRDGMLIPQVESDCSHVSEAAELDRIRSRAVEEYVASASDPQFHARNYEFVSQLLDSIISHDTHPSPASPSPAIQSTTSEAPVTEFTIADHDSSVRPVASPGSSAAAAHVSMASCEGCRLPAER